MPASSTPVTPADQERRLAMSLVLLTMVSGLVDATSYLQLGHVFVANMTGNIVFVGFALAGAGGLSPVASAVALAAFFAGALGAGRLARARPLSRPRLLAAMAAIELALVLVGIAIGLGRAGRPGGATYAIVGLLAGAMGAQSVMTSRLQVPGFNSTVVLTTMLGTLASTSRLGGGSGADNGRRLLAISSMLAGGLVGALLTLRVAPMAPLGLAAVVIAAAGLAAARIAGAGHDRL
jgi:uncharacterized membrane protein YoaK (UPF0700 family)